MKKVFFLAALIAALIVSCGAAHAADFHISGAKMISGRAYLPVAQLRELGIDVTWNQNSRSVLIETWDQTMLVEAKHGLVVIDGRAYFPLRHLNIMKAVEVKYDPTAKTVIVTVEKGGEGETISSDDEIKDVDLICIQK